MRSQFPAFPVVIVNKAFDLQPRRFAPSVNVKAIQRLSCKKRQLTLSSDSHNVFTQKAQLHRTAPGWPNSLGTGAGFLLRPALIPSRWSQSHPVSRVNRQLTPFTLVYVRFSTGGSVGKGVEILHP
jgi:hypothetical protein